MEWRALERLRRPGEETSLARKSKISDAEKMKDAFGCLRITLLVCCGWFLFAGHLIAQTPDTAALRGVVIGPDGALLTSVTVVIKDTRQQVIRSLITGTQGTFVAEDLPVPNALTVEATHPGFATAKSEALVLAAGATASLQLRMEITGVHSEIRVTGTDGAVRAGEP